MSEALLPLRRRMERQKKIPRTLPPEERLKQTLDDVRPGGALEYADQIFLVTRETQYKGLVTFREFTLEEVESGDFYSLEFALLDEWDIVFWEDTDVVISQVEFGGFARGVAIDTTRVRSFLEDCKERDDGFVLYDGTKYSYTQSSEGDWVGEKNPQAAKFTRYRSYTFGDEAEAFLVAFSVWEVSSGENEITVSYGRALIPENVVVLALGENSN
ncbi:hypothetical protein IH799_02770, partial [candidate division KSB1 bacterium]|nr:hypothetical protein [candidate division KSB1 bacterium]